MTAYRICACKLAKEMTMSGCYCWYTVNDDGDSMWANNRWWGLTWDDVGTTQVMIELSRSLRCRWKMMMMAMPMPKESWRGNSIRSPWRSRECGRQSTVVGEVSPSLQFVDNTRNKKFFAFIFFPRFFFLFSFPPFFSFCLLFSLLFLFVLFKFIFCHFSPVLQFFSFYAGLPSFFIYLHFFLKEW